MLPRNTDSQHDKAAVVSTLGQPYLSLSTGTKLSPLKLILNAAVTLWLVVVNSWSPR